MTRMRIELVDSKAKAALERLERDGAIRILGSSPEQDLADLMRLIRRGVKKKLTVSEVLEECDAVRRDLFDKPRHAAARKPQARR